MLSKFFNHFYFLFSEPNKIVTANGNGLRSANGNGLRSTNGNGLRSRKVSRKKLI